MDIITARQLARMQGAAGKLAAAQLRELTAAARVQIAKASLQSAQAAHAQAQAAVAALAAVPGPPSQLHVMQQNLNGTITAVCGSADGAIIRPATAATCPACLAAMQRLRAQGR